LGHHYVSQTLGTAIGDWTADTAGLGYLGAALIFGGVLAAIVAAHYFTNLSKNLSFLVGIYCDSSAWCCGWRLLDKPVSAGGLALSRYSASATLIIVIIACILIFPQRAGKTASH